MGSIRLMLVDDHDVIRTGLKTYLDAQEGFEVVSEANSGEKALELVLTTNPDIILMDISMQGMDGLEVTRRIKEMETGCKILALTVHSDKQYFFEMLAAGADGYLTKQAAADELVGAIRAVFAGQVYLQPTLAAWLLEDYRRLAAQEPSKIHDTEQSQSNKGLGNLSDREIQVLQSVAEGLTNVETGERLGISHKTVARHRERIMSKLDIHTTTELVKFAIRTGVIKIN